MKQLIQTLVASLTVFLGGCDGGGATYGTCAPGDAPPLPSVSAFPDLASGTFRAEAGRTLGGVAAVRIDTTDGRSTFYVGMNGGRDTEGRERSLLVTAPGLDSVSVGERVRDVELTYRTGRDQVGPGELVVTGRADGGIQGVFAGCAEDNPMGTPLPSKALVAGGFNVRL